MQSTRHFFFGILIITTTTGVTAKNDIKNNNTYKPNKTFLDNEMCYKRTDPKRCIENWDYCLDLYTNCLEILYENGQPTNFQECQSRQEKNFHSCLDRQSNKTSLKNPIPPYQLDCYDAYRSYVFYCENMKGAGFEKERIQKCYNSLNRTLTACLEDNLRSCKQECITKDKDCTNNFVVCFEECETK